MLVNGEDLQQHVMTSLLPFLRCSAMFFHFFVGVELPEELKSSKYDSNRK